VIDSLGFRKKFGVIAPSTDTAVQPEYDEMRPRGVSDHFGRIHIPKDPIRNDEAGIAEFWLDNPVMVISPSIDDKFDGFGSLARH
jgi:maleate isomerase